MTIQEHIGYGFYTLQYADGKTRNFYPYWMDSKNNFFNSVKK